MRLGLEGRVSARLTAELCLPAVGQGALGIESRDGDERVTRALALVHDAPTSRAVGVERGILKALGADCKTPIAAFAELDFADPALLPSAEPAPRFQVRAWIAEPDGSARAHLDERIVYPNDDAAAEAQGLALGRRMLESRG